MRKTKSKRKVAKRNTRRYKKRNTKRNTKRTSKRKPVKRRRRTRRTRRRRRIQKGGTLKEKLATAANKISTWVNEHRGPNKADLESHINELEKTIALVDKENNELNNCCSEWQKCKTTLGMIGKGTGK